MAKSPKLTSFKTVPAKVYYLQIEQFTHLGKGNLNSTAFQGVVITTGELMKQPRANQAFVIS